MQTLSPIEIPTNFVINQIAMPASASIYTQIKFDNSSGQTLQIEIGSPAQAQFYIPTGTTLQPLSGFTAFDQIRVSSRTIGPAGYLMVTLYTSADIPPSGGSIITTGASGIYTYPITPSGLFTLGTYTGWLYAFTQSMLYSRVYAYDTLDWLAQGGSVAPWQCPTGQLYSPNTAPTNLNVGTNASATGPRWTYSGNIFIDKQLPLPVGDAVLYLTNNGGATPTNFDWYFNSGGSGIPGFQWSIRSNQLQFFNGSSFVSVYTFGGGEYVILRISWISTAKNIQIRAGWFLTTTPASRAFPEVAPGLFYNVTLSIPFQTPMLLMSMGTSSNIAIGGPKYSSTGYNTFMLPWQINVP